MNENLMKEIILRHKEDVSPPFNDVLDVIGIDSLYFIASEYGGSDLYIPTAKRMFSQCINKQILKDFTGDNYMELSRRYGMSARNLRGIIEREYNRLRTAR